MCEREHNCDNREHGEIAAWPRHAQSFAEPEDAEGDDDDADAKLERVFRYTGKWTMDRDTQCDDYDCGCTRSQSGWDECPGHTPDCDDYQHYFNTFDDHGLEGGEHRERIQAVGRACIDVRSHRVDLATINRGFIAMRFHTSGPKYCFPQPRKAKQQQHHADDDMQIVKWYSDERTTG